MADLADPKSIYSADSIRDPLTGAYSRALLQERYQEEIDRARRYAMPCSLCLFDVDYFKSVNDAYGHTRGDQVLRELVHRLLGIIRSSDLLFRYGGDEFILLLPNTPKAEAVTLAKRILDEIHTTPFPGTPALTLSLSIGVANFPEDAPTSELLFEAADRRNYAAKRRGRGCVIGDDTIKQRPLVGDDQSRLIERDEALEHLYRFLEQLPTQHHGVLAVAGLPGSGRTRFLRKVAEAARLRGYAVVALSGTTGTQFQPYGTLLRAGLGGDPGVDAAQIMRAILERAQGYTGLVLTVDNMAGVDRATLNLLRHLLTNDGSASLAVVYSVDLDRPRKPLHGAVPLAELIELPPLSLNGLRIWLRSLLHWEAPAAFVNWLHQETDGLPGAIQRGLAYLIQQDVLSAAGEREWIVRADYQGVTLRQRLGLHSSLPPNKLPVLLTEFVGREQEIQQVIGLLDKRRLVTLLGPGGIGKTRLALKVATELLHDFTHGVFFVALDAVSDSALVAASIARTFAIKEVSGQSLLGCLKDYLQDKEVLLVLDNFEQITPAAPLLSELLTAAPGLKIVVTSRQVLRLSGEHIFAVPPLSVPGQTQTNQPQPPEVLARYAAVALFASRAQAVQYDWTLTQANAHAVTELCARLDGLPLAIELAAARCNDFSPEALLLQIDGRLALLSDGPRDVPTRQQTLRGAIDWSYSLLSAAEQRLFARLAVFAGSCSLSAVEAVCAVGSEQVQLADLTALIDKSLLLYDQTPATEPRFKLLETIREYALEQLAAHGETERLLQAHAAYYLAFVEQAEPQLRTADQQTWLGRLEDEHYNIQAALEWAIQAGEVALAARLGGALWRFWAMHTHLSTGRRWYATIAAQMDGVPASVRARVLLGSGTLAWLQGDYGQGIAPLEESVALFRSVDDQDAMAAALNNLGLVTREQGDYTRAQQCFTESLAVREALGDRRGVAFALGNLGRAAFYQGEVEQACRWNEESLMLFRELGDPWGIAVALYDLGEVILYQRSYDRAAVLFQETLTLSKELGDKMLMAHALRSLGDIALAQADLAQAGQRFVEALSLQRATGDQEGSATSIDRLARLAVAQAQPVRAARLAGATEALRAAIGSPIPPIYLATHQELLDALGQQLSPAELAHAWAEGGRLGLEQAIVEALGGV